MSTRSTVVVLLKDSPLCFGEFIDVYPDMNTMLRLTREYIMWSIGPSGRMEGSDDYGGHYTYLEVFLKEE